MATINFYIDGRPTGVEKAKQYFIAGLAQQGLSLEGEFLQAWLTKSKIERSREIIHNYSAIQADGGLEVIVESEI